MNYLDNREQIFSKLNSSHIDLKQSSSSQSNEPLIPSLTAVPHEKNDLNLIQKQNLSQFMGKQAASHFDHQITVNVSSPTSDDNLEEKFPGTIPISEQKRMRNMFTSSQIEILEKIFEQTHYPDSSIRNHLSSRLNLSVLRIQVWFQNRRAKFRKIDSQQRKSHVFNKKNNLLLNKKSVSSGHCSSETSFMKLSKDLSNRSPTKTNVNFGFSSQNTNSNLLNVQRLNKKPNGLDLCLNNQNNAFSSSLSSSSSSSSHPFTSNSSLFSGFSPSSSSSSPTSAPATYQPINVQSYFSPYSSFIQNQNQFQFPYNNQMHDVQQQQQQRHLTQLGFVPIQHHQINQSFASNDNENLYNQC